MPAQKESLVPCTGIQAPLSPEIIASPAYQTGKLRGTAKDWPKKRILLRAMIRRGLVKSPPIKSRTASFQTKPETQIEDISYL